MKDFFILHNKAVAFADSKMANSTVKNLWHRFCLTEQTLDMQPGESCTFRMGSTPLPQRLAGTEYALCVDENGIAIRGKDYGGLMRGFMSLLMKIEHQDGLLFIRPVEEQSGYLVEKRMIHICIFPENDLYFVKKLIRLIGLCQYTHVVLEFWGMLRYDCLKELAWPNAFTKDQAKELIDECRVLGVEPVPMFNHLGHASGARSCFGKHVLLDQNPRLERLLTPDGWVWDINSREVSDLLKQIREELYQLFGSGEYFHMGCDEANFVTHNAALRKQLPRYLAEQTAQIESEGRRPMLWMDMLLEEKAFENCYSVGKADEVAQLRNATARSTVFVDWQYGCTAVPIPSTLALSACDRAVMGAAFFKEENHTAHVDTARELGLHGVMLTTWHLLKEKLPSILSFAKKCGAQSFVWSDYTDRYEESAALMRRVSFEGNTYEQCGWSKTQIEV